MKPKISVPTAELNKLIQDYSQHSKRDLDEIVNQKAYSILIKAAAMNRTADRAQIISELGQTATAIHGQKVRIKKDGTIKRGKLITERIYTSILYAIVLAKARKEGRTLGKGGLEAAARKELSRRLSSVSFMKSGWFAALQKIGQKIGKPLRPGNLKRAKRGFGGSSPARWLGYKTQVSFWNTSFNRKQNTTDPHPTRWAESALQSAIDSEMSNMKARIAAKLEARLKRLAAKPLTVTQN